MTGREKVNAAAKLTDLIEDDIRAAADCLADRRAINALGVYMDLDDVDLAVSRAAGRVSGARALLEQLRRARPTDADYDQV
jgi:hypothetical protein